MPFNEKENYSVRCWHCGHFLSPAFGQTFETPEGICKIKNQKRWAFDTICFGFYLRQGIYTKKRYPPNTKNKENP